MKYTIKYASVEAIEYEFDESDIRQMVMARIGKGFEGFDFSSLSVMEAYYDERGDLVPAKIEAILKKTTTLAAPLPKEETIEK